MKTASTLGSSKEAYQALAQFVDGVGNHYWTYDYTAGDKTRSSFIKFPALVGAFRDAASVMLDNGDYKRAIKSIHASCAIAKRIADLKLISDLDLTLSTRELEKTAKMAVRISERLLQAALVTQDDDPEQLSYALDEIVQCKLKRNTQDVVGKAWKRLARALIRAGQDHADYVVTHAIEALEDHKYLPLRREADRMQRGLERRERAKSSRSAKALQTPLAPI